MGRAPCCDKANVKKGPWSPEEDAKLKGYIEQHGTGGNWIALPQKIGLKRCGKSCRLRWLNYLRPNIKHGDFSEEEDNIICSLYISIGSRWSIIAAQLPGRTDNDIKNYWNTRLKKKLLGKRKESNASHLSKDFNQDVKDDRGLLHEISSMAAQSGLESLSSSALERMQLHIQLQCAQSSYDFFNPLSGFHHLIRNQPLFTANLHTIGNQFQEIRSSEGFESLGASPEQQTQATIGTQDPSESSFSGISSSNCIIQDGVSNLKPIDEFVSQLQDLVQYNYQQIEGLDCPSKRMGDSVEESIVWLGDDSDHPNIGSWDSSYVVQPEHFPFHEIGIDQYGMV